MPAFRYSWYLLSSLVITWLSSSIGAPTYNEVIEKGATHTFSCSILSIGDVQQQNFSTEDQEFVWHFNGSVNSSGNHHHIINQLNGSSSLTISNALFQDSGNYECQIVTTSLNLSESLYYRLLVGTKPSQPKDLQCRSTNMLAITCTWDPGNSTNIPTNYTCHWESGGKRHEISCSGSFFSFQLTSFPPTLFGVGVETNNDLGSKYVIKSFRLTEITVPNPPTNGVAVGRNDSVILTWNIPSDWKLYNPIQYKIRQNNKIVSSPQLMQILAGDQKTYTLPVSGLNPFTNYTFEMALKSNELDESNDKWSPWSLPVTIQTLPSAPEPDQNLWTEDNPTILRNYGCWKDIYLQWKSMNEVVWNGIPGNYCIIFSENITDQYNRSNGCYPNEIMKDCITLPAYSKNYTKMGIRRHITQKVCISAINSIGCTPLENNCLTLTKDEYSDPSIPQNMNASITTNKIYVTWHKTLEDCEPTFDIFWNETEPCPKTNGKEQKQILKSVTTKNTSLELTGLIPGKEYAFGFVTQNEAEKRSKEYHKMFTTLSSAPSSVLKNLTIIQSNVSSELIIKAKLPPLCEENGVTIDGYTVYYSNKSVSSKVDDVFTSENIDKDLKFSHLLSNLRPYTNYSIQVSLFTTEKNNKKLHGPKSELVAKMTKEKNPGKVQNVSSHTSRSGNHDFRITIQWDPPKELYGKLKNYTVKFTKQYSVVEHRNWSVKSTEKETNYNLKNLEFYTNYTIQLTACISTGCSTPVNLSIETPIGEPTAPIQIEIENHVSGKGEMITLKWNKPVVPNGPLSYYRIEYYPLSGSGLQTLKKTKFNDTMINLDCSEFKEYGLVVAAVNEDVISHEKIIGEYSQEQKIQCTTQLSESSTFMMELLVSLALLLLICCIILGIIFGPKLYRKYCAVPKRPNLEEKSLDHNHIKVTMHNNKREIFDDPIETNVENNKSETELEDENMQPVGKRFSNKGIISAYSSLATKGDPLVEYVPRYKEKNEDHVRVNVKRDGLDKSHREKNEDHMKVNVKMDCSNISPPNHETFSETNEEETSFSSNLPLLLEKRNEGTLIAVVPEQIPLINNNNVPVD